MEYWRSLSFCLAGMTGFFPTSCAIRANDPRSTTAATRPVDCNRDVMPPFASLGVRLFTFRYNQEDNTKKARHGQRNQRPMDSPHLRRNAAAGKGMSIRAIQRE